MRLFKAIGRLIAETCLLIIATVKQAGKPKMVFAAVVVATLAAVWLVQANADVAIPGRVISNRADMTGGW